MKILFTVCGRAGSKGIHNKNIRNFLGTPLALYTLSAIDLFLQDHTDIEYDIVLNTDSPELVKAFRKSKMREVCYISRDKELAGDVIGKIDVIRNCLLVMEEKGNRYDMVIDLDITSPLRQRQDLAHVFAEKRDNDWDVVFTVTDSRRNPYFNMVKKNEAGTYEKVLASNFTARQQAPEIFDMNASIYAFSPSVLKKGWQLFDGKCGIVKMYDTAVLDLDHESDFELMEVVARYLYSNYDEFSVILKNIK